LRSCSIISTSRSLRRNRVAHARVQSRRLDAGRIDPDKMIAATNAALSAKFGEGKYITAWWNPTLYVDYKLIKDRKLNKVEVENGAQAFLREYPGVEAVFTRTQMENGMMPNTKLAKQVILAWHQQISGDIVVMNKPNWYLFAKPSTYASTHGSPWSCTGRIGSNPANTATPKSSTSREPSLSS
jgi:hypothetical protein